MLGSFLVYGHHPDRQVSEAGADSMGEVTCLPRDSWVKPQEMKCSQESGGPESYNHRWR